MNRKKVLNQNYLFKIHKIDKSIYLFFLCFIHNVQYIKHDLKKKKSLISDAKRRKEEILHLEKIMIL